MLGQVESSLTYAQYANAFQRIQEYICNGDCYQVNFAQRFSIDCQGNPWLAYRQLRDINPAPFSAYLQLPFVQVLSASPERFLSVNNGRVTAQPIKGTRPRSAEPGADWMLGQSLQHSAKDRAENVMIVDLLRNDLSKSCALHSVKVPKLFELQSFATVHHLVTTVTGRLDWGQDALDILRGCFPGGSITGAPKIRAMEIIEQLEPHRRGLVLWQLRLYWIRWPYGYQYRHPHHHPQRRTHAVLGWWWYYRRLHAGWRISGVFR